MAKIGELFQTQVEMYEAEGRAMQLLRENLSREQLKTFDQYGWFLVKGKHYTYRIHCGITGNIGRIDPENQRIRRYCAYPPMVPTGDVLLTQKLMLEFNEAEFLRIAYHS